MPRDGIRSAIGFFIFRKSRDGNRLLRSPLVDKELKSIRKMRDANTMAGMISQAKRQMTSKVVRESQKVIQISAMASSAAF